MDWMNVEPDKYNLLTKHYTPGRGGAKIEFVTLHHMAMIGDIDDCVRVWQDRPASAHYAISPTGMIGQAVNDSDTAWSNANLYSNQRSISIEHSNSGGPDQDWPISEATLEAGAHLVAALCRYYKLGLPESGKNVRFHNIESGGSTACPYHLRPGHKYHDQYIRRAQYWYDEMTGKAPAKPVPPKKEGLRLSDIEELKKYIDQKAAENRKHLEAWLKGFVGPIGGDVKDVRQQVTGGRDSIAGDLAASYPGWDVDALVNTAEDKIRAEQGLTAPEMLALAAYEVLNNSAIKDDK